MPLIGSSRIDPSIGRIVAYHRREQVLSQLRCALKELLSLQGVSFTAWARQVVWQRLHLPKSIRPAEWPEVNPTGGANLTAGGDDGEGVDLNATAIVFDLDSSVLMPGEQADLSLNATFATSVNLSDNQCPPIYPYLFSYVCLVVFVCFEELIYPPFPTCCCRE